MIPRRTTLALTLAAPAAPRAQSGPPLRMVVPYAPGGSSDTLARLLAPGLTAALSQTVVVENRAGAGSMLGTEAVARSAPDGTTVLLADMPHTIVPAMQPSISYDPVADFAPITRLGVAPFVMFAHPAVQAGTAAEFVALARPQPDRLAVSSGGSGSASHLVAELFQRTTGIRLTHVPYRGAGPAMQDLAAGQVQCSFSTLASAAALFQGGQVKAIGVFAEQRAPDMPEVPTLKEQGIDLVVEHWWGILAPARSPAPTLQRLHAALAQVMATPELAPRLAALGVLPRVDGPAPLAERIAQDLARWRQVVREANITP